MRTSGLAKAHLRALVACVAAMAATAPAAAQQAAEILAAADVRDGLVVHVGTADGKLEADLAADGTRLVQGLTTDAAKARTARTTIDGAKVAGLATVTTLPSLTELPYNDHMVNLLVADLDALGQAAPRRDEILRVLRPLGVAYLRTAGRWEKIVKPMPAAMDDWSHADHGPDGNAASRDALVATPQGLQWYSSGVDGNTSGMRLAGGRWFGGYKHPGKRAPEFLGARDAFNGLPLWRRGETNGFGNTARGLQEHGWCANDAVVAGSLIDHGPARILDAATGKDIAILSDGLQMPRNVKTPWGVHPFKVRHVLLGDTLVQAYGPEVVAFDAAKGAPRWRWKADAGSAAYLIAADGRAFVAMSKGEGNPGYHYGNIYARLASVTALDIKTGQPLWTNTDIAGYQEFGLLHHRGALFALDHNIKPNDTEKSPGNTQYRELLSIDAATGKTRFKRDMSAGDPLDKDRAWHVKLIARDGLLLPTYAAFARGYDATTGDPGPLLYQLKQRFQDPPLHCSVPRLTANGMVTGKFARFVDFRTGEYSAITVGRTGCDAGSYPAYGMIYTGAHACGCTSFLRGHMALQCTTPTAARQVPADQRLEKGPSFGQPLTAAPAGASQWPGLLGDAARAAASNSGVPGDLKQTFAAVVPVETPEGLIGEEWRTNNLRCGAITPPVIAGDTLVIAATDAHRVYAFDARDGKAKWSFTAGGRIDSSPTLHQGLCIFGSNDGHVYALRISDGALAWRFLAAPNRRQLVASGQLESLWPVHGSIMIHKGKAFVVAGRHNQADGGMFLYRLDPATGAVEASRTINGLSNSQSPPGPSSFDGQGKLADVLATNLPGTLLYCGPIVIDPVTLHWVNLSAAGSPNPRKGGPAPFLTGPGAPDLSWSTPALTAFLFAGSTGAVDIRSDTDGVKGASGFRFNTTASWTGANFSAARLAVGGRTLYAANRGALLKVELDDAWKPREDKLTKFASLGGGRIAALLVAPDRVLVAENSDKGGVVQAITPDGTVSILARTAAPIVNYGLAAAGGKLYVSTNDGQVLGFAGTLAK